MGKGQTKVTKTKIEPAIKKQARQARISRRLEKKTRELNKRYPGNKYEIKGNLIVRISGVKPHKKSKKAVK